jgi:hypothetical protein
MHRPIPRSRLRELSEKGGVLVTALLTIGVLSALAGVTLHLVSARHAATYQSVCWNEALASAETGADFALKSLNASLTDPVVAWAAWSPGDATTFPKTYTPTLPGHAGEGNTKVFATVTVDDSLTDSDGQKWFRVRSMGVTELPIQSGMGIEPAVRDESGVKNHRSALRKARFQTDLTGGVLRLPQVARTIELMAQPVGVRPFVRAVTTKDAISLGGGAYVDSFDSSDSAYSTGGLYDPAKRQANGSVASNENGTVSTLGNSFVYGDASSKGGVLGGTGNVQGVVSDKFQAVIADVAKPIWSTIAASPALISNPTAPVTLTGGPAGAAVNYKLSELTVSDGTNPVILAPHTAGQESYINIWVTGSTAISGTGFIQQMPGVHVRIYVEENVTVAGGGIVNQTERAENLQILGVTPTTGTRTMSVTGGTPFIGAVNAPAFAISISGGAPFVGAVIGNSVSISGAGGFHYDEHLSTVAAGIPTSYQFASWVEDTR